MSKLTHILAAGLVALAPSITFAAEEGWIADFDEAVTQAKAEGKDLLVDFTGSDWCGWCIKLHDEVFSHAEFSDYANEHFVLVALDFPNGEEAKAKVPNPERNQELSEKYEVGGFPTILLMNVDGEVFGRTGYRPNGPGPYVEFLKELMSEGKGALTSAKEHVARFEAATDENRMEVLGSIIEAFEGLEAGSPAADVMGPHLRPIVERAIELDADNAAGLKLRAVRALLMGGEASDEVIAVATELDPKNEMGLFERVVQAKLQSLRSLEDVADFVEAVMSLEELGIRDAEVAQDLYGNTAWFCWKHLDRKDDAVAFANKCLDLEPEDQNLVMMLQDLLNNLAPEEEVVEEEVIEEEPAE